MVGAGLRAGAEGWELAAAEEVAEGPFFEFVAAVAAGWYWGGAQSHRSSEGT